MKRIIATLLIVAITIYASTSEAGIIRRARNALLMGGVVAASVAWVHAAHAKKCRKAEDSGFDYASCYNTDSMQDQVLLRDPAGIRELRKNLVQERELAGVTPADPGSGCETHHIVPEEENRIWARDNARKARAAINGCVDINSEENGIFSSKQRHAARQPKLSGVKSQKNTWAKLLQ
jgi:hypothetical protein